MTVTAERQDAGWAELERLGAVKIARPRAVRDYGGRMRRAEGAEWDWWYAGGLSAAERDHIRRHHMVDRGVSPDQLAGEMGLDIDAAMAVWVDAVRLTRRDRGAGKWERDWDTASWYPDTLAPAPGVLIGPAEIALLLGRPKDTVYQWVTRGVLPEPWDIVSGTRLWPRYQILSWAVETGRLPEMPAEAVEEF